MYYEEYGVGQPLVLVHGFGSVAVVGMPCVDEDDWSSWVLWRE
jgi:hypothetical protein